MRSKDFVITAEIPIDATTTATDIKTGIEALRPVVDAVQIGDDRAAVGHVDPLAVASIAVGLGVDPVLHLSCRDRNRIALKGRLLGAALIGVSSVMLMQGKKLPDALRGKMKGVFDTRAPQLIEMARYIGDDHTRVSPPGFCVGSYVSAVRPGADWKAKKVLETIDSGANFLQTAPCLNLDMLTAYMEKLVALKVLHRASVIVELPLLSSVQMANDIKESRPGSRISKRIVQELAEAKNPGAEGYRICRDAIIEMKSIPGISGVNIIYASDSGAVARLVKEVTG